MKKKLKSILLIDDNAMNRDLHKWTIHRVNDACEVISEQSAANAFAWLKEKPVQMPELILLDLNMPGMSGWEFLEAFKTLDYSKAERPVIIMLTSSNDPADIAMANAHEILNDFKTKPLTEDMMMEITATYFCANDKAGAN